ncbi:MAG: TIR domain-containing protein [Gemmatimonadota bacterium]
MGEGNVLKNAHYISRCVGIRDSRGDDCPNSERAMMPRRCFYSFHYKPDCARAAQVRQIGAIEGNKPASDNDWESITKGGDAAIKKWIDGQMKGKACAIVLIGSETADRKWINYEIVSAWNAGLGVVGIHIHSLKNFDGKVAVKGANPFDFITHGPSKKKLSSIVRCYNPAGVNPFLS